MLINLHGPLQRGLASLGGTLKWLSLANNQLSGDGLARVGPGLGNVRVLNVSGNRLGGGARRCKLDPGLKTPPGFKV